MLNHFVVSYTKYILPILVNLLAFYSLAANLYPRMNMMVCSVIYTLQMKIPHIESKIEYIYDML